MTTKIGARPDTYGPAVPVAAKLDVIDLHQVAQNRAGFAKELIDQLLWEIDSDDEELAWAGVRILGEVTEKLQTLQKL